MGTQTEEVAMDSRAEQLANLVLDYSISLQPQDRLLIQFDPAYAQYAIMLGRMAKSRGASVRYDSMSLDPRVLRGLVERNDSVEQKEELARRIELSLWCNARIYVDCKSVSNYAEGIENSEERVRTLQKEVIGPYKEVLYRQGPIRGYTVKWNLTGFPCKESAKVAGMTMDEYSDFVYAATLGNDWQKMSESMKRIKAAFDGAKDVHLLVPGLTDLHLSLSDRGGEICDGRLNMPDGEICYGPVENSVQGTIYFPTPTKRDGLGMLQGIKLKLENGVITDSSAKMNPEALESTLKTDEGVKRIGELGIGCNYGIKRATLETLFDEKIGGTIHLALGDSFREQPLAHGGGLNKSSVHWDIVCDLRRDASNLAEYPGGQIYVDGKLVQQDGVWQI